MAKSLALLSEDLLSICVPQPADLSGVEALVRNAVQEPYYRPGLTALQLAENERIVGMAASVCRAALKAPHRTILAAFIGKELSAFAIVDHSDRALPEIDWFIVAHEWQGRGVAGPLLLAVLKSISANVPVKLGVIETNRRAIRFYERYGFVDAGPYPHDHEIARRLMVRPALSSEV